jgi:hypothetical protein
LTEEFDPTISCNATSYVRTSIVTKRISPCAGLAILEIEGAKTFGLVAFTLLPAAIGISAKAEWKKLVKFAESHRK